VTITAPFLGPFALRGCTRSLDSDDHRFIIEVVDRTLNRSSDLRNSLRRIGSRLVSTKSRTAVRSEGECLCAVRSARSFWDWRCLGCAVRSPLRLGRGKCLSGPCPGRRGGLPDRRPGRRARVDGLGHVV